MTTETKTTSSETKLSGGILMPVLAYSFRVLFGHCNLSDIFSELTQQAMNCEIDMKNHNLTINLRQPIIPGVFKTLDFIIQHPGSIYVEPFKRGNDEMVCTLEFHSCECIEHSIDFNYAKSEVAIHKLKFKYSFMDEFQPVDWEKEKSKIADEK